MIQTPRTVLLVDDDETARHLYERALALNLPDFTLVTAANGAEALAVLSERPVEVLVTDLHMPVMDGLALLDHVRERHPNLGVIVLSSMPPERVAASAPRLGSYRRVAKPIAAPDLAAQIRAAAEERVRGHIAEVPLAPLLQLLQLERSTCSLLVRSGARKGRLHFRDGELVNAYAFELDADGEVAARHLLAWERAAVDFERSLHNHVQRIHTPLAELLLDVAREQDEGGRDRSAAPPANAHSGNTIPPIERATALDAALGRLSLSLGGLRARGTNLAAHLAPVHDLATGAARLGVEPLTATTPAPTVDGRLADLARHLAERAHVLGDELVTDLPPSPTWTERHRS